MVKLLLAAALALATPALPAPAPARDEPPKPVVTYKDDTVSLKAKDAPVDVVIDAIRQQSGAEVRGAVPQGRKVTAEFDAIPTQAALERILGTQNFALMYGEKGLRTIDLRSDAEKLRAPAPVEKQPPSPSDLAPDGWWKMTDLFRGKRVPIEGKLALIMGQDETDWDNVIQAAYFLDDPAARNAAIRAGLKAFEADRELRQAVLEATAGMDNGELAHFVRGFCRERGEKFLRAVARTTNDPEIRARFAAVAERVRDDRLAGKPLPFGKMPPRGQRH